MNEVLLAYKLHQKQQSVNDLTQSTDLQISQTDNHINEMSKN
jgi:hypothetical protein